MNGSLPIACCAIIAAVSMICQIERSTGAAAMYASPIQEPGDRRAARTKLPGWLSVKPEGWGEETWREFQTALMKLRAPIMRTRNYTGAELQVVTAEVEHWPGDYEDHIKREWDRKWQSWLTRYERTGGCGCCNEVYTVTGPKAAIEEFPVHPGRRNMYPRYHSADDDR